MAVIFDPKSGGFMTVKGDVDPTTAFGESKTSIN